MNDQRAGVPSLHTCLKRKEVLITVRAEVANSILTHIDALSGKEQGPGQYATALSRLHGKISTKAWRALYKVYINE